MKLNYDFSEKELFLLRNLISNYASSLTNDEGKQIKQGVLSLENLWKLSDFFNDAYYEYDET